jgi:hypothetical protein
LCIIGEVEENPSEKRIDVSKRLGLPLLTLNLIIVKDNEIIEQAGKRGTSVKKRVMSKELAYSTLKNVLFA